ncbi:MAG: sulfite exporter TauE/SafE family protein [Fimbriimonadaceae bacterium]
MIVLGYALSLLVGITMGLIGAGGAILTVPILVYLFGVGAADATGYSLFIVSALSFVGASTYLRRGEVPVGPTVAFGVPSIMGVLAARAWVVPLMPKVMGTIAGVEVTKDRFLLLAFATLMVFGALAMIRKPSPTVVRDLVGWQFALMGTLVGFVTGMVGAGGGFLIIPALVCFAGLEMKAAVGSSLSIIAVNAAIGFFAFIAKGGEANWLLLAGILLAAGVGLVFGLQFSKRVDGVRLKPVFGFFVLLIAGFIFFRELLF